MWLGNKIYIQKLKAFTDTKKLQLEGTMEEKDLYTGAMTKK